MGADDIHKQNGEGYALRIAAGGIADEHGDNARAQREYDLAPLGGGRGGVIGEHEDAAQQHAAGEDHIDGIITQNDAHERDGSHIHQRDGGGDDPANHQINKADDEGNGAGFAQTAAADTEEQILDGGEAIHSALLDEGQGGRAGNGIDARNVGIGGRPGGHLPGKGDEQEDTAGDGGIGEITADAAEQLLDDNNSDKAADHCHPNRKAGGQIHCQQQAGHGGAQIRNGISALGDAAEQVLEQDRSRHTNDLQQQGAGAKNQYRRHHGRQQGNEDITHDGGGGGTAADMRPGGNQQFTISHILLPSPLLFYHLLAQLVIGHQMALGRTYIGTAAAFHAQIDMERLQGLHILGMIGAIQRRGAEAERAGPQTAATADAGGLGRHFGFFFIEDQQAVIGLADGGLVIPAGGAHHGAAQNDLGRFALVAAAEIDDVLQLGADGDPDILRLGYRAAIHRDHTAGKRQAGLDILRQLDDSADIHDQYTDITGELALRDDTAGGLVNDDLFGALGVAGFELQHLQLAALRRGVGLDLLNGLGLVIFDANDRAAARHMAQNELRALQQQVGLFQHDAVIAGEVGFALGTIDDEGIDGCALQADQLDAGGESRAAQAH